MSQIDPTKLNPVEVRTLELRPEDIGQPPAIIKEPNPKDIVGSLKWSLSVVPMTVIIETALAMLEGALKYGRHNYRGAPVKASIYYDAAHRHIISWWEGEDTDPDSELSHITKAIASLVVLRDAMIQETWIDDRPPRTRGISAFLVDMNKRAKALIGRYGHVKPRHFTISDEKHG